MPLVQNSFGTWSLKPRGQPLEVFPGKKLCFLFNPLTSVPYACYLDADVYSRKTVVQKCIFLPFSFVECADTRNGLELESKWKPEKSIREEFEERFPGCYVNLL